MKDIEYSEIDKALQGIMREVSSLRWKISKMDEADKEIESLKTEVAIARERLGHAGWKLLQELKSLRTMKDDISILKSAAEVLRKIHKALFDMPGKQNTCVMASYLAGAIDTFLERMKDGE